MARAVSARAHRKHIVVNKGDDIYLCSRIFSSQEFNTDINCHREINLIGKFSIFLRYDDGSGYNLTKII